MQHGIVITTQIKGSVFSACQRRFSFPLKIGIQDGGIIAASLLFLQPIFRISISIDEISRDEIRKSTTFFLFVDGERSVHNTFRYRTSLGWPQSAKCFLV